MLHIFLYIEAIFDHETVAKHANINYVLGERGFPKDAILGEA